jgi:hypothetical protein
LPLRVNSGPIKGFLLILLFFLLSLKGFLMSFSLNGFKHSLF